jgi:hypothetical protein
MSNTASLTPLAGIGSVPLTSRLAAGSWLDLIILLLATHACFTTIVMVLRGTGREGGAWLGVAAACTVLFLAAAAKFLVPALPAWRERARTRLERMPLFVPVAIGLVLRLAWVLVFPSEPTSDSAIYLSLAHKLQSGQDYEMAGTRAYWPIGFPLYLSAWMSIFGPGRMAWMLSNFALYLVAVFGVARVGSQLCGPAGSRFAALLVAVWPSLVAYAATPEKEMLIAALLPWVWSVVLGVLSGGRFGWRLFLAGALLGFCILVQPSLQLLPFALFVLFATVLRSWRALGMALMVFAGAAVVVAPWTLRNHAVLGSFVLVSTNGGDNLYRANNPLATGGYTQKGEVDLSGLRDIDQDREGKRLALEWMRTQPVAFGMLALEKQIRFMGDDSGGVYTSLRVGGASSSETLYFAMKAASNMWWMLMWALLGAAVLASRAEGSQLSSLARIPLWMWLYLFVLHSVFESSSKYHEPVLWVLPVLIAAYLFPPTLRKAAA